MNDLLVLHAWLRPPPGVEPFGALLKRLPYAKRIELERRDDEARLASLAGIALALRGLEILRGHPSEPGELAFPQDGKPRLRDGPCFSISHSGEHVGVALSSIGAAGFDLEDPDHPRASTPRSGDGAFGAGGGARYQGASAPPGDDAAHLRLQHWTAVEAVLKAAGRPLRDAALVALDGRLATGGIDGAVFHITPIGIDGIVAHAATDRPVTSLTLKEIALSSLASDL